MQNYFLKYVYINYLSLIFPVFSLIIFFFKTFFIMVRIDELYYIREYDLKLGFCLQTFLLNTLQT